VILSMTGYGTGEAPLPGGALCVEIRSVNSKTLDARVRMPREYSALEAGLIASARAVLARGRVQITVERRAVGERAVVPDLERARAYAAAVRTLAEDLGLDGEVSLELVAAADGVLRPAVAADDLDEVSAALDSALDAALAQVTAMREQEGRNLAMVLGADLLAVTAGVVDVRRLLPEALDAHKQRLAQRIRELAGEAVDRARLAQEAAMLAERADLAEELDRLESHVAQFGELLDQDGSKPVGRRLDFLAQEMFREANTLGSKGADAGIVHRAVEIKAAVERLREQTQNVL